MYRKSSCSEVLGIVRKTTMNQSGYWCAGCLLVTTFIKELRTNSHTHTHTHTHTHKTKCVSVSGALQKAPVSSWRQLLLLWCYACSLINIRRRVRSTAHLTVQGLTFIRELLAEHRSTVNTPLHKNISCISRTSGLI